MKTHTTKREELASSRRSRVATRGRQSFERTLLLPWLLRIVVVCASCLCGSLGYAADETVTDAGDNGGPNQLRAKINAVQAAGGGTVVFAVGGTPIVLSGMMLPEITTNLMIDGGGVVTISGGNASRILRVRSSGTLSLRGLTLTKGFQNGDGGALINEGTTDIENCRFIENQAGPTSSGGAILSLGRLTIRNSDFTGNKGVGGGAIYPRFGAAMTTISGCLFSDNQATGGSSNGWGGALLLWDGAPVTIVDSNFTNNTAHYGGAINVKQNSRLIVVRSRFSNNAAVQSGGGIENLGTAIVTTSTFTGNSAAGSGGAISNLRNDIDNTDLSVTESTLSGNAAKFGGGISSGAIARITNVTLSGNSAEIGGGASVSGSSTMTNATFSGNSATTTGGGIYVSFGNATLRNTIFARGAAGGNCRVDSPVGGSLTGSFNLSDDATCGFGSGRDSVNLLLGPLAENGGVTATHLPQPGSPVIDNGTGAGAPATDQRGVKRPQGIAVDAGAVEVQPTKLANISTRLRAETGDNVLIGGFIVTGSQPKRLIVRAIGPSLPFSGALPDPQLEIFDSEQKLIASNNNWQDAPNRTEISDSTIAPSHPLESAVLGTVAPGAYTAVVSGVASSTGISLVEVYDLDRDANSELANISTRGLVQTGDDVMIGGFILLGDRAQKVIIRGIGPSLSIAGKLMDPELELYDGAGTLVRANNNWRDTQESEINASTIPPSNDLEAAIVATLPAGPYTAVLRGRDGQTGVAVIEVYALN